VVLIGEIRDRETMEHALTFADTGHLVLSTLHAHNANQALDRIVNLFPEERRPQLLHALGNNLKAFVSQRLVRTLDGQRRAAVEVMLGTPTIADLIRRNEIGRTQRHHGEVRRGRHADLRRGAVCAGGGGRDQ
jgi:twitching motility protein PilU